MYKPCFVSHDGYSCPSSVGTIVPAPQGYEPLLFDVLPDNSIFVRSDLCLLVDQRRSESLDPAILNRWKNNLSTPANKSLENVSDADIWNTIKPRNIQSPSELNAWIDYLTSAADDVKSTYEQQYTDTQTKLDELRPNPTPTTSADSTGTTSSPQA